MMIFFYKVLRVIFKSAIDLFEATSGFTFVFSRVSTDWLTDFQPEILDASKSRLSIGIGL